MTSAASADELLPGIRLGVVRGTTYGLFGPPEEFVPQARALGAGIVRVNIYWSQVEPEPGRFVWTALDALLEQLDDGDEAWVTVCASSEWATRRTTRWLPASPALDIDRYRHFVRALAAHRPGRIRFWQCEIEPCLPLFWAGTAGDYLTQLRVFHDAVEQADPAALVVLAEGIRRNLYYPIAPEWDFHRDSRAAGALMFGKLQLLDSRGGIIGHRHPAADAFESMARLLRDVTRVRRIPVTDRPDLYLFEAERSHGTPALVVWERGGDEGSANELAWEWRYLRAHAVDVYGARVPVDIAAGMLRVPISPTPVFIDSAVAGGR
ncbi:hypothetical protein [Nocardia xishanensis]|uniref:hypothetical protein n=1 Tax=Nocardia xishanensis TaxID=238964 RepID=UPI00082E3BD8|nr:hypothetical protein [Nocardia xishanensis]